MESGRLGFSAPSLVSKIAHTHPSIAGARMKAKVAERGQVTDSKGVTGAARSHAGNDLDFEAHDDGLVAAKVQPRGRVEAAFGVLGQCRSTDELMSELRDPA